VTRINMPKETGVSSEPNRRFYSALVLMTVGGGIAAVNLW
jgi:hypothetical protein